MHPRFAMFESVIQVLFKCTVLLGRFDGFEIRVTGMPAMSRAARVTRTAVGFGGGGRGVLGSSGASRKGAVCSRRGMTGIGMGNAAGGEVSPSKSKESLPRTEASSFNGLDPINGSVSHAK